MTNMRNWIDQKLEEQHRLYEQYGKPFEKDHTGEFVAISHDGETILGKRMGKLLKRAIDTFGRDNFAMARIGHETMTEWLLTA